jgi:two-component system, LuxR family, response regulator FixJ
VDFLEKPFNEQTLLASVGQALERDCRRRALEGQRATVAERLARLTPREQEVLGLVVSDLSNKEIARRLAISPKTVEHHRGHLMAKMQARTPYELLTMAVICGAHELRLQAG